MTITRDKKEQPAHARLAELDAKAAQMETAPEYDRDNSFRQEAIAVRADAARYAEEHFDELLAEKAAEAVAAHEARQQAETAYGKSRTPETESAFEDANAATARMAQPSMWQALLDTPKGRQITRDARELSIHEVKVLTQSAQAAMAAWDGYRSGWSNTTMAPRQVPMPREFAEYLGVWTPILR